MKYLLLCLEQPIKACLAISISSIFEMSFSGSILIMEGIIMINRTELEHFLTEKNVRIPVDKLLSEYRSKMEIGIFIRPWVTHPQNQKKTT